MNGNPTRDGRNRAGHRHGHHEEDRGQRRGDGHRGAVLDDWHDDGGRVEEGRGYQRGREVKLHDGKQEQTRQQWQERGSSRSPVGPKKRYRSPPDHSRRNEDPYKKPDRRNRSLEVIGVKEKRKDADSSKVRQRSRSRSKGHIDARNYGFKSIKNEESGYGSSFAATPNEPRTRGAYGSGGWRGGRGFRGSPWKFTTSTPAGGRGRGGWSKEQGASVGGRAYDFLADRCLALEEENKTLRAELPKKGTLQELESLRKNLEKTAEKLEKSEAEVRNLSNNKYRHEVDPAEEDRLSKNTSSKVKKCLQPLLIGSTSKRDIKYGIRNLFSKLEGKAAWDEAVGMVRRFGTKEAVIDIISGLTESIDMKVGNDGIINEESDQDIIGNITGVKKGKKKIERRISFSSSAENGSAEVDINKAPKGDLKSKKKKKVVAKVPSDKKTEIKTHAKDDGGEKKSKLKKNPASPKAGSSGISKFASNKKKAFNKRTECNKKKQEEVNQDIFNDTTEGLDRGYNEGVLRREGSPEISAKLKTPDAPQKMKEKKSKTKEGDGGKKEIAEGFSNDEKAIKIKYSMGNMVVMGVLGKLYNLKETRRTEQGGRVLDKSAKSQQMI